MLMGKEILAHPRKPAGSRLSADISPNSTRPNALRLNAADNVVIAMRRLEAGERVDGEGLATAEPIPSGHKVAVEAIRAGATIHKYGQVIGVATADVAPGAHVHTHNVAMSSLREGASVGAVQRQEAPRTFEGYRRATGKVGARNYIGVLTSVNCSATVARHIAEAAERQGLLDAYPDIDGIDADHLNASGYGMAGSEAKGSTCCAAPWRVFYRRQSQLRRRLAGGSRLRSDPDRPAEDRLRPGRGRHLPVLHHPGHRRDAPCDRGGTGSPRRHAAPGGRGAALGGPGQRDHARTTVRWLRAHDVGSYVQPRSLASPPTGWRAWAPP